MGSRILILDYGSQFTQLIARRVREARVYSEIHPPTVSLDFVRAWKPSGIILSGGPASIYGEEKYERLVSLKRAWDPENVFRLNQNVRPLTAANRDAHRTYGRIKRLQPQIGNERFMLTWGDGVSNVDLWKLLEFHKAHGKLATVTAVRPPARFGHVELEGDRITEFSEKPQT